MIKVKFLFFYVVFLSAFVATALSAQPMRVLESNKQRYVYDVFYKKMSVGQMIRELQHNEQEITASTTTDLSFLFYHFGIEQLSHIYWDQTSQLFLSKRYVSKGIGFSREQTQAVFFKSGHQAKVTYNGKPYEFVNEKEKIIDFNTVAMQLSEGLKGGQTDFEFYMQTKNKVKHYFFEVAGKEVIITRFGKFNTYKLKQTRKKDRKLILWFAPELNYQLVKFRYKYNLIDLSGILTKPSTRDL